MAHVEEMAAFLKDLFPRVGYFTCDQVIPSYPPQQHATIKEQWIDFQDAVNAYVPD